jgi:hypothetical protein
MRSSQDRKWNGSILTGCGRIMLEGFCEVNIKTPAPRGATIGAYE